MPQIGDDDLFEFNYMSSLRAILTPRGLLLHYDNDRAAIDLGIHFFAREDGKNVVTGARVWIQAKGLRSTSLSAAKVASAKSVASPSLPIDQIRFWYNSPEPVYLVLYVESIDQFFAADVRALVDDRGGLAKLLATDQEGATLRIPKEQTLARAIETMPRHRTMRVDGKQWRGRPLGHGFDPLRSELAPMSNKVFLEMVNALLIAHDFQPEPTHSKKGGGVRDQLSGTAPISLIGRFHLTYEWVLPMTTEFGYDEGSDFRIEGEPLHTQGDVVLVIDPTGAATRRSLAASLDPLLAEATSRRIQTVMLLANGSHNPATFGSWFGLSADGFNCAPQDLASLTFNILTTTNVYLAFHERLAFKYVNYL